MIWKLKEIVLVLIFSFGIFLLTGCQSLQEIVINTTTTSSTSTTHVSATTSTTSLSTTTTSTSLPSTTTTNPSPSTPTGLSAIYESTYLSYFKIYLQWNANPESNIRSYFLYRSVSQEGTYSYIASVESPSINAADYIYPTGNYAKTYYYKLIAVNTSNQESAPSSIASVTTPPTAPTGLTLAKSGSNINLSWSSNPEPNTSGYNIYRKISMGSYTKINSSPTTEATYINPITQEYQIYYYKITALIGASESGYSGEQSISISSL